MPTSAPLSQQQITDILDEVLQVEFSFRNTEPAAESLATAPRPVQDYLLDWVRRATGAHVEIAYQFSLHAVQTLEKVGRRVLEAWVQDAMDTYDREGLRPALAVIRNLDHFLRLSHERRAGAVLDDKLGVLLHFVHGLSGRRLNIEAADIPYTDTETLYLPPIVADLQEAADNFLLYKAMAVYLWAQTRFGSFRVPLLERAAEAADPEHFLACFHALDTLRLEARIARELPGLHREMMRLKHRLRQDRLPAGWESYRERLSDPDSTAGDVLAITSRVGSEAELPPPVCYQGRLAPESVAEVMAARLLKEKAHFRSLLRRWVEEQLEPPAGQPAPDPSLRPFGQREIPDPSEPDGFRVELTMDGKPLPPPEEARGLITSIIQDLGHIPDDYLVPAGPGEYDPSLFEEPEVDPDDVWKGTYHEEGATLVDEWDFRRQTYRKNWCAVREKDVEAVEDEFVSDTLQRYSGLVKHLRNSFEAIRDEDRLLRRQVEGENVDIDALVEGLADVHAGHEMSDRLFTRMHRRERDIAVLFMVDMSGSTKGWINDAERESLVLLCEALETLGDRYAIYGFSGNMRKRCEIYRIKKFDEGYTPEVRGRISGIRPQDYTRMGFAIRHLCAKLNETGARNRILITLSDGKPDDFDNYRGEYGIEDTRKALIEARRAGIHPYCITIDEEGRDYLPHLYGPAAFTVVNEVRKLPLKVSDIYRRLTT
jgi:nitric oxide reductase NorD protein